MEDVVPTVLSSRHYIKTAKLFREIVLKTPPKMADIMSVA